MRQSQRTDTNYIGIDIAKDKLDVWVEDRHRVFSNDEDGLDKLVRHLRHIEVEVIVMEATGGLETAVAMTLADAGYPVAIVNPRQVRDFAKALGKLAKTDKLDAQVLSHFGDATKVEAQELPSEAQQRLRALVSRRRQIISILNAEKIRLRQSTAAVVRGVNVASSRCHMTHASY